MKIFEKKKINTERVQNSIIFEQKIMLTIKSKFLLELIDSFETAEKLYYVMPFMIGGDLFFHIKKL
jgi:serine/threonine protein kinase